MKKHQNLLTYFLNPNCYNFCIFYIETHLNQKHRSICKISSNFMPPKFFVTFHSFFSLQKVIFKKKQHACGYKSLNQIRVLKHPSKCLSKKNSCMNLNTEKETDHPNSNINIIVFFSIWWLLFFQKQISTLFLIAEPTSKSFLMCPTKTLKRLFPAFDATLASIHSFFSLLSVFVIKQGLFLNEPSSFTN